MTRADAALCGTSVLDGAVAAIERPGRGGTVLFAHANGLNAGAYRPMMAAMATPLRLVFFDARGHGRTALPADPSALTSWHPYARDIGCIAEGRGVTGPLFLAGHSMGAVSALLAAAGGLEVAGLVLIEPVILPKTARLAARTPGLRRLLRDRGIAAKAARRRNDWPGEEAARAHFAKSGFFSSWQEDALRGYLDHGLVAGPPARLSCDPAWEAATFAAQAHSFWRALAAVEARGVPIRILKAEGWSTVPEWAVARLARRGTISGRAKGGHLLPQVTPDEAARFVDGALASMEVRSEAGGEA